MYRKMQHYCKKCCIFFFVIRAGLALGSLEVKKEYQNTGVGSALAKECIQRPASSSYPWITVLGGDYYSRFGFERGNLYGITVSDDAYLNEHLQILFLDGLVRDRTSGRLGLLQRVL